MHIGISMNVIDHNQRTRSEARELALKLREQFDLTSVEIIMEGIGRQYAPYPWEYEEEELKELEAFLAHFPRRGAHLPFYDMNVIAMNVRVRAEAMEQMLTTIEIAKRLKLDYGVMHATGTTNNLATDKEPRRHFKAFSRCADICRDSGLSLSIENADRLHNIGSCLEMIRSLKKEGLPISMTFDTGHANIAYDGIDSACEQYGTPADAIEHCIEFIDNIHLHNNDGSSDQHKGLLDGNIDLKSCISRLRDLKYQGSISLEFGPYVENIEKEIATLKEWSEA
ncbi:MAG: sugar phosphate isomerase/epimerase [Proteobacteria bacterium]|nr:sugar phosphate isomerase/epimerase [Pseudomonadota bacterium]